MSQRKKINLPVIIRKKNNNQVVRRNPTNYPVYSNPQIVQPTQVFRGNIVNGMRFGNPGDMLSGYVQRELVYIDRNGNKQIATAVVSPNNLPQKCICSLYVLFFILVTSYPNQLVSGIAHTIETIILIGIA